MPAAQPVSLPPDARLVELRASHITFRSRRRLSPGTRLDFALVMEGRPWPLQGPITSCEIHKERDVSLYEMRISLESLRQSDRQLIALFIEKGRGAPGLAPAAR